MQQDIIIEIKSLDMDGRGVGKHDLNLRGANFAAFVPRLTEAERQTFEHRCLDAAQRGA